MVLVPEARTNRQEVRGAIAAQFWGQPVGGARSLDGLSRLLPCEPPAPPQTAPSGLSRAQQLLAFQAVALPAVPAFNASQGGLVSRLPSPMRRQTKTPARRPAQRVPNVSSQAPVTSADWQWGECRLQPIGGFAVLPAGGWC